MSEVAGRALVLDEGLSLWGGMDPVTGELIDSRHPQRGALLTGRVLVTTISRKGALASRSTAGPLSSACVAQA